MKRSTCALAAALPLLAVHADADAVTKTWVVQSGNWSGTFNWSPAGAPADFDDVSLSGANGLNKTVTYDVNDGFLHVYGTIGLQSAGFGVYELRQPGTSLEASQMSVAGTPAVNGRARHVLTAGGTAFVGSTFLGDNGSISLGQNSAYQVGSLTQQGGAVSVDPGATFTVTGRYAFDGGATSGAMRV